MKQWTGEFGREYTERNLLSLGQVDALYHRNYGLTRSHLNEQFLAGIARTSRVLEVGSNVGNQLLFLQHMGFGALFGIELQSDAVELAKSRTKRINLIEGTAFDIPFKDGFFDLVFTSGLLIHISPADIHTALAEIHRCTSRYIWGLEYYAGQTTEIEYQGRKGCSGSPISCVCTWTSSRIWS